MTLPQDPKPKDPQQQDPPTYFVFSSLPQPVWGRSKFRNDVPKARGMHDYYNVMWDPRVKRGDPLKKKLTLKEMQQCLKRRPVAKPRTLFEEVVPVAPATPPPVEGRCHLQLQTDKYLETLEGEVASISIRTQTEALHEVPINPWFVATKIGEDKATQIQPEELFNFDVEVQPLIETLIGKVVEQALLECMEEEELASLIDQQMKFEESRRAEQLRLKRLEDREKLLYQEHERLMMQVSQQQQLEEDVEARVGAAAFASIYLTRSGTNAITSLRDEGFLNSRSMIGSRYTPWLNPRVGNGVDGHIFARTLVDDIIQFMTLKHVADNTNENMDCEPKHGEVGGEDGQ